MNKSQPFISIIIPTYARDGQLATGLKAFTRLQYPRELFELIVVSDGSPFPLEPVISPFTKSLDVKLVSQSNAGPAAARNTGAAQARGDYLVFTDDDCMPDPDWLNDIVDTFQKHPGSAIGGQTVNLLDQNLFSTASQMLVEYLYLYYNQLKSSARFFTTNNLAVPTSQFWQIGGFHPGMPLAAGEDREFCDRWLYHGFELHYAHRAVIYHAHPLSLAGFWRQHFKYGRGACLFHLIQSRRNPGGVRLEPLSFYINLLVYPWRQTTPRRAAPLSLLLTASQLANALGFFWQRALPNTFQEEKKPSIKI